MKILHIGDIAGVPSSFRDIERAHGHKSNVVHTHPHPFRYPVDYEFQVDGKNWHSLKETIKLFSMSLKYDRLHYHDRYILCGLDLVLLRLLGKEVIVHYHGSDIRGKKPPLVERIFPTKTYVSTKDLLEFVPGAEWIPNMILESYIPHHTREKYLRTPHRFRILHTPTDPEVKGTAHIVSAVNRLKAEGFDFDFSLIRGKVHSEILQEMATCDLYIDQLLIGFYGVSSLECACMGVPVVCFVQSGYESPFINATSATIYDVLKGILKNDMPLGQTVENQKSFYLKMKSIIENLNYIKMVRGFNPDYNA